MRWLTAPGSLTARLRVHGPVTVRVLREGTARLCPQERRVMGGTSGHVREVSLSLNGEVVVWARSVTPQRALKGPWKALKGLGHRPLAELLFNHQRVQRGPLGRMHWAAHGPEHGRLRRHQTADSHGVRPAPLPRWARHSTFVRHGQPLQVLEAFWPAMGHLHTA